MSSDDLGVYRVYGLVPGRYRVRVNARRRSDLPAADGTPFVRTCHPSTVIDREASDVILTSDDATGVDIRVQRARRYSKSWTSAVRMVTGGQATRYLLLHVTNSDGRRDLIREAVGRSSQTASSSRAIGVKLSDLAHVP